MLQVRDSEQKGTQRRLFRRCVFFSAACFAVSKRSSSKRTIREVICFYLTPMKREGYIEIEKGVNMCNSRVRYVITSKGRRVLK